jgi:hypothetical protein
MSNSDDHADIDFMVITQNSRLWTTRFLLTLYTEFLGLRRRPLDPHTSGKVCLNLYLTPMSYELPNSKRSLYTAYELIQTVPLYDPSDTHSILLASNPWIMISCHFPPNLRPLNNEQWNSNIELVYRLQLAYMRPRLTREYITPDSAFFHPHDPSPKI